ncbi:MAG: hypothetical protein RI580_01330 [Halothece sp. Uz-M2-17]|nr:hypothetical protein [Halothece sp. Uz-M2-17]
MNSLSLPLIESIAQGLKRETMVLQIICFCLTWGFILLSVWSACRIAIKGKNNLKTLHQIPCSRCAFFTNDYRLKCTVNPYQAGTESAIGCRDFEPKSESKASCLSCSKNNFYQANI